jgi:mRNA interferase MazF
MWRAEVWWVTFDPSVGGEVQKERPAVIISNDSANRHLNRLQVLPLSTNIDKVYPGETLVTINSKQAKVLASQLTTVSKLRVSNKLGQLSPKEMQKVEQIVKLQLGF